MKTLKTLSTLVLAAGLIFTSCKKKDSTPDPTATPNDPSISLTGTSNAFVAYVTADYTATVGDAVKFKAISLSNTTSGSKLDHLHFTLTQNNQTIIDSTETFSTSITNHSDSAYLPTSTVGVSRIQLTITDKAGLTATVAFNLTVVAPAPSIMAIGSGNITLGGANNTTLGSYANLQTGAVYLSGAAQSTPGNVELVYNDGTVYSPTDAAETNTTIHAGGVATKLDIYTAKAYASITAADINAYTPTGTTKVTLTTGTVVMFSTGTVATGGVKKGVFVVNSIAASATSSDNVVIQGQVQQ